MRVELELPRLCSLCRDPDQAIVAAGRVIVEVCELMLVSAMLLEVDREAGCLNDLEDAGDEA